MFPKPISTVFWWILVGKLDHWELGNPESCIFCETKVVKHRYAMRSN